MSPEINQYGYKEMVKRTEKRPSDKKVETYKNTRSWGSSHNKVRSVTGVWRK